jgi:Putative auto-transporter adhesin, head GIN domain
MMRRQEETMVERIASVVAAHAVLAATLLTGCFGPRVVGSGKEVTQARQAAQFRRIEIRGSTDVVARVGAAAAITVSGDDNIVPHVRTEVRGDTLVIDLEDGSYSTRAPLRVTVSTPSLDGISISGSASAQASGVEAERFEARISGSGDMELKGSAGDLAAWISGSGDMRLYGLSVRRAEVDVSGSGNVQLSAAESLDVEVSGSGDVSYRGNPARSVRISGSGSVEPG